MLVTIEPVIDIQSMPAHVAAFPSIPSILPLTIAILQEPPALSPPPSPPYCLHFFTPMLLFSRSYTMSPRPFAALRFADYFFMRFRCRYFMLI